jgi:hypothetical protein
MDCGQTNPGHRNAVSDLQAFFFSLKPEPEPDLAAAFFSLYNKTLILNNTCKHGFLVLFFMKFPFKDPILSQMVNLGHLEQKGLIGSPYA